MKNPMEFPQKYEITAILSQKKYSSTYEAICLENKKKVVIKIYKKYRFCSAHKRAIHREAEALKLISHPHIIKLINYVENTEKAFFVLEHFSGQNLLDYIESVRSRDIQFKMKIMKCYLEQIIDALSYLHRNNIYHCDLKPENILVSGQNLKICDFGSAIISKTPVVSSNMLIFIGSPNYAPPEKYKSDAPVSLANLDLWALGCIIYHMFKGFPPFYGNNADEVVSRIREVRYNANLPLKVKFILQLIFIENPEFRIVLSDFEMLVRNMEDDD
ncbi:Protein kinase domain [Trinorchestia longiramus]|nr:Protein kinase domain [Trinorchestia longiramus]